MVLRTPPRKIWDRVPRNTPAHFFSPHCLNIYTYIYYSYLNMCIFPEMFLSLAVLFLGNELTTQTTCARTRLSKLIRITTLLTRFVCSLARIPSVCMCVYWREWLHSCSHYIFIFIKITVILTFSMGADPPSRQPPDWTHRRHRQRAGTLDCS